MTKFAFTRAQSEGNVFLALSQFQDELERRIAFGQGQWTWDGVTTTATATITHELDSIPRLILITPIATNLTSPGFATWRVDNRTATQFDAVADTVDASTPGAGNKETFYWLAIS